MEYKTLNFTARICGTTKMLSFVVPVENGYVVTNKFCPQDLLTGRAFATNQGLFGEMTTHEPLDEFISDCKTQIVAMGASTATNTKMDAHIGGLMESIMKHLTRFGRLIFGDLRVYVDCFSYILLADGFSEEQIKSVYPRIIKKIVDLYPEFVKNDVNLAPLKETPMYWVLNDLVKV